MMRLIRGVHGRWRTRRFRSSPTRTSTRLYPAYTYTSAASDSQKTSHTMRVPSVRPASREHAADRPRQDLDVERKALIAQVGNVEPHKIGRASCRERV